MNKRIDNKFSVTEHGTIVNSKGIPIPDHEPKILFRGKDKLAVPMLHYYLALCIEKGCTQEQEQSMRAMIDEFKTFQEKFSATVKLPD